MKPSTIFEVRKLKNKKETVVEVEIAGKKVKALIDSGCTISAIDSEYVKERALPLQPLKQSIPVRNADGTMNEGGAIVASCEVEMKIDDHIETVRLMVTKLTTPIFLGHDWLQKHNPTIDWTNGNVSFNRCTKSCEMSQIERIGMVRIDLWLAKKEERIARSLTGRLRGLAQELAIQQNMNKANQTFEEVVPEHYHDFKDVFEESTFDALPERRACDHVIELMPDAKPFSGKAYRMTAEEEKSLEEFLEENLKTGRIRPSKSPWAAPFFFIKKKDGKLRPVQDYRKLNSMTKKNAYPLPLIGELLDKLSKARYFTKLDIRWGYNNIRIAEGDEEKAAFMTTQGLFEPTVMFFGLCNAPATFQAFMNEGLKEERAAGDADVYLDDIIIAHEELEDHRRAVRKVLQRLRDMKVTCKPAKCEFEVGHTEYLGHIISHGQVGMDPVKVQGVADWPEPTGRTQLKGFLGFANFYRRFIEGFSHIATTLNKLSGKAEWVWDEACQTAFDEIKRRMLSAPVLAIPDRAKPFRLETDASAYATGAVLSQEKDGLWHPVAFLSKTLNDAERNYAIYDRELLAIIRALDEWRHFLMGTPFEIFTDHKNLEYFKAARLLNTRQVRWYTKLQEYTYTLVYKPGKRMEIADKLSRRPDHVGEPNSELTTIFTSDRIAYLGTNAILELIKKSSAQIDLATRHKAENKEQDCSVAEDGSILRRGGGVQGCSISYRDHCRGHSFTSRRTNSRTSWSKEHDREDSTFVLVAIHPERRRTIREGMSDVSSKEDRPHSQTRTAETKPYTREAMAERSYGHDHRTQRSERL